MKFKLESWNLAQVSTLVCTQKFQSNFFHISCHQLSTAVNSWWQLITVDENENQLRELKFGTSINIRLYIKIPVELFSYQLSSAVNSYSVKPILAELSKNTQLIWVELSLAWSGFIYAIKFSSTVISCWQLLTADESWYEKNLTDIFMYNLKLIHVPNFSSLSWI